MKKMFLENLSALAVFAQKMMLTVWDFISIKKIAVAALIAIGIWAGTNSYKNILKNQPKDVTINLAQFSGRIFPQSQVHPGTFKIEAPMAEAITWGQDAILSYDESGVQVWKPDNKTNGVFLYAKIDTNDLYDPKTILSKENLTIKYSKNRFAVYISLAASGACMVAGLLVGLGLMAILESIVMSKWFQRVLESDGF